MNKLDVLLKLMSTLDDKQNDSNDIENHNNLNNVFLDKYCIVRTYSAGVWAGYLDKKYNDEVILKQARRLYYWKTNNNGISLSEIALTGCHNDSKICSPVEYIWLQAIEIIPTTNMAKSNIIESDIYKHS